MGINATRSIKSSVLRRELPKVWRNDHVYVIGKGLKMTIYTKQKVWGLEFDRSGHEGCYWVELWEMKNAVFNA